MMLMLGQIQTPVAWGETLGPTALLKIIHDGMQQARSVSGSAEHTLSRRALGTLCACERSPRDSCGPTRGANPLLLCSLGVRLMRARLDRSN
jgi:hypothetical protein